LDLGSLELAEELPGVGREALDVAALALGEERVEREARLAGAADAREHHELALGDPQLVDLEVVLRGPPNLHPVRLARGAGPFDGLLGGLFDGLLAGSIVARRGGLARAAAAGRGNGSGGGHRGGTVTESPFSARSSRAVSPAPRQE